MFGQYLVDTVMRYPCAMVFLDEVFQYNRADMMLLPGLKNQLLFFWVWWLFGSTWLVEGRHRSCGSVLGPYSYTKNIQRCWVHILTEADKIVEEEQEEQESRAKQENKGEEEEGEERGGDEGEVEGEAEALGRSLHGIYDRLKEALEKKPPPHERRRLVRNGRKTLRYWINKDYRDVKVSKFVEKIRRAYPYLFTAVTHPGVDLHNNRSERGLRELVVQRKIIGTLRNEKGTYIYETLATLLATWKHRGLDPLQALSTALTQTWKTQTNQLQLNT